MLFAKKEMDVAAAKRFWAWFEEQEGRMIENLRSHGMDVVWAIDAQIKPVFPYFKKELEFQLGFNNGKGEFFFFHFGDKHLIRDVETLANLMPETLKDRWTFIAER